ncbi:MAG: branched-chain amino acid ABC transporter permease LivH [Thermoleophilia bacterium]
MDWERFFSLTVDGATRGSVYALIALGFSMVYGILKLLNFAHGDVFMVGGFIGWGVIGALGGATSPVVPAWAVIVLMVVAAMVGCSLLGVTLERFAYRPLRQAPRIAPLISALGASFFLQNSVLLLFGADFKQYETIDLAGGALYLQGIDWGAFHISLVRIVVIAVAIAMMVALSGLVYRTQLGKAMRATAYDREAAAMMGIDVDRVIMAAFFVGSALAGAAGVLVGLFTGSVNHFMGFNFGLKAFTAAVVGGIGSIPGAMLGGLVIGFAEAYAAYIDPSLRWRDLLVFSLLVLVMIFRPSGLLGRPEIQKV